MWLGLCLRSGGLGVTCLFIVALITDVRFWYCCMLVVIRVYVVCLVVMVVGLLGV